ncbi:MAG: hypothetical protein ABR562_07340 [Thermoplasmatota archaeon]
MTGANAGVSITLGALLAGLVAYAAWRVIERRDPGFQARRAGRHARLATKAATAKLRAATHEALDQ